MPYVWVFRGISCFSVILSNAWAVLRVAAQALASPSRPAYGDCGEPVAAGARRGKAWVAGEGESAGRKGLGCGAIGIMDGGSRALFGPVVDCLPVCNPDDLNHEVPIIHRVDHTVIPDPDS